MILRRVRIENDIIIVTIRMMMTIVIIAITIITCIL